jgi:dTDP-glucose pyrophosphorylase
VEQAVRADGLAFVRQEPQLGTGHAVQQAAPLLEGGDGTTLVLNGDVPLIETATLRALVDAVEGRHLALLTVRVPDPHGYGRIVREGGNGPIVGIVEHKDASAEQLAVDEIYTGVMAAPTQALRRWLGALRNDNAAGEYYLTDVVGLAVAEGTRIVDRQAASETEVLGVNSPAQLADLERASSAPAPNACWLLACASPTRRASTSAGSSSAAATSRSTSAASSKARSSSATAPASAPTASSAMPPSAPVRRCGRTRTSTARGSAPASARAHWSAPSPGCAAAPGWAPTCTSATSSK